MRADRDTIIKEIQRIARETGVRKLNRSEFISETGISAWSISQEFEGWREACELAGIETNYQQIPITDDELFNEILNVFIRIGSICTKTKFDKECEYSVDTYRRRFGKWEEILIAFKDWIDDNSINFKFYNDLPSPKQKITQKIIIEESAEIQEWPETGQNKYGSILNFRCLQHAPINEQGVVFLFGMICEDLKFVVESIRTEYPDCEAKRLINKKTGKMERVKIEFEFKSGNFKDHGHNPELCDVIICWENNWPDCPIEVIELKTIIKTLK